MATYFRDDDIPGMFSEFGIPITIGGVAGVGIKNESDELFGSDQALGQVINGVTAVLIQTTAFPALAVDQAIAIDGRTGIVASRLRAGDGALCWVIYSNEDETH